MSAPSPTIEGFRAAFRRPSLTFAEIAWRWTLGATAASLFVFYGVEYLDTLPVTSGDSALLATRQPALVGRAIAHILRGSLNRAVLAAFVAVLALSVFWIIAASIGRLATVRALLDYFRSDAAIGQSAQPSGVETPRPVRALIDLNFFRVAVLLGMILALAGAAILSGFVSSTADPKPGLVFILFVPLAVLICFAAWTLNWWLSLAAIFAVRDGEDAMGALSTAVSFFRAHSGSVAAVSTWTGLAHLVAISVAMTAASLPLAFIQVAPARFIVAGMIVVALLYFVVADWLYVARLAGYICIAKMPEQMLATPPLPPELPRGDVAAIETTIDRDEPILSDLPHFA